MSPIPFTLSDSVLTSLFFLEEKSKDPLDKIPKFCLPIVLGYLKINPQNSLQDLNNISDFFKELVEKSSKYLKVENRNSAYLLDRLNKCIKFRSLELKNNQMRLLPKIQNLSNIRFLDLAENELTYLPKEIEKLNKLCFLDLSRNRLTCLAEEIGKLIELTNLWLSDNQLGWLPNGIWELRNLKCLKINKNHLLSLSDKIKNLTELKSLRLEDNKFIALPKEVAHLPELNILFLNESQKKLLPESAIEVLDKRKVRRVFIRKEKKSESLFIKKTEGKDPYVIFFILCSIYFISTSFSSTKQHFY